jgi:hypothetical protein
MNIPTNDARSTVLKSEITKRKIAIPLQSWAGPEDSSKLRLQDFKTIST